MSERHKEEGVEKIGLKDGRRQREVWKVDGGRRKRKPRKEDEEGAGEGEECRSRSRSTTQRHLPYQAIRGHVKSLIQPNSSPIDLTAAYKTAIQVCREKKNQ
jgi:hypothetical protein